MQTKELATKILEKIGGESNITHVTHCATRLRIQFHDASLVQLDDIDRLEGVLKAQIKGGQLQVVIGAKVNQVYDAFTGLIDLKQVQAEELTKDKNLFNRFFEMITSIITPLMAPLLGSGMIKCLALLITTFGWLPANSGIVSILNMMGDALFYFFPFFLAVSAAKKFKANTYMAVLMAACLMHPTILNAASNAAQTGITEINFLGLPIPLVKYSSTLIPIIFSVWVLSKVQPIVEKFVPDILKLLLVPMITLIIMVPLELIVIGPIGYYGGNFVGVMIQNLYDAGGFVSGFLLGFLRPILVMFGMHYAIQPIMLQQINDLGFTTLAPSAFAANLAQAGAVCAVFFLTKDKMMKSAAGSSTISAIFGITEPAIYGVNLKYKRPFFAACLAAGIVSAVLTLLDARVVAFVLPNVLSVSALQTSDGSLIVGIIGVVASFVLAFIFAYVAGIKENKPNENKVNKIEVKAGDHIVASPMEGNVIDLTEVEDKIFSQELIGKGAAIQPTSGKVFAPFDGRIETLLKSKHAIGIMSKDGVECLIHVGLDTVNLEGKYYTAHVKQEQEVKKGDLILEFDLEKIKEAGYEVITPVVITNTNQFEDVLMIKAGSCKVGESLLQVKGGNKS